MVRRGYFQDPQIPEYWNQVKDLKGPCRGPLHQLSRLLTQLGLPTRLGVEIQVGDQWQNVLTCPGLEGICTQAACNLLWARLAATRNFFGGLASGRDNVGTDGFLASLKTAKDRDRWAMIQADAIVTPWRAHQACGADPSCPRCGNPTADLAHMVWECPVARRE